VDKYSVCNRTKQTLLGDEVELAAGPWGRLKGLLGRQVKEFIQGKGILIVPSQGVHTLGMSFPIDAAYLDRDGRVIHVCHQLAPFRIAPLKLKSRSVLELPAGTLARTRTEVGDMLEVKKIAAKGG